MKSNDIHIEIDDRSGFCFGVVNAISKAEESIAGGEKVYSLGDIVHNGLEVERLERLGLKSVRHEDLDSLAGRTLLIRAHGEPPSTYEKAAGLGINIIDATCPVVAKLQELVADAYRYMKDSGGQVVIFGKRGHAEVVGLAGQAEDEAIVIEGMGDLERIDFSRPIFLLSQTTQSLALFEQVRDEILKRAGNEVTVRDTICRQVSSREAHLREFAQRFDVVLFVSGHKSSNGKVLFGICREANPACHRIESSEELCPEWFKGQKTVGVCGATSTPHWLMEEVARKAEEMLKENIS